MRGLSCKQGSHRIVTLIGKQLMRQIGQSLPNIGDLGRMKVVRPACGETECGEVGRLHQDRRRIYPPLAFPRAARLRSHVPAHPWRSCVER